MTSAHGDLPPRDERTDDLARLADRDAFDRLYRRIAPALHVWASLRIRPAARPLLAAEDLVQETWYRALRIFSSFDAERCSFRAWIFRVAKNVLLEAHRYLRRQGALEPGARPPARSLEEIPDEISAVSRRIAKDEAIGRVVRLLASLPRPEKALLLHVGLEEMSHAEVARLLGISRDAVAKRWQRLRTSLTEAGVAADLLALAS